MWIKENWDTIENLQRELAFEGRERGSVSFGDGSLKATPEHSTLWMLNINTTSQQQATFLRSSERESQDDPWLLAVKPVVPDRLCLNIRAAAQTAASACRHVLMSTRANIFQQLLKTELKLYHSFDRKWAHRPLSFSSSRWWSMLLMCSSISCTWNNETPEISSCSLKIYNFFSKGINLTFI